MHDGTRPIDPEELLSQVARLRALARRLVDEGRADDVVQQALLVAIERPPRSVVPFGPWLVGVVRNLARRTHRANSRRRRHESARPHRAPMATPDELAARSEALRDLADAVHRLDPPFRDVVVLHYFDGLTMPEVAERLHAPLETVRTRLKRALARLRERLAAEHDGDDRALSAVLVGPGAACATAEGGLAVTSKSKVAMTFAAAFLCAVTVAVSVLGGRDPPTPTTVAEVTAPSRAPIIVERPAPEAADSPIVPAPHVEEAPPPANPPVDVPLSTPPERERPIAEKVTGSGAVLGAVRFAATRKPAAGRQVVLEAGEESLTATTDSHGIFRFEHLAESRVWRVRVASAGFATVTIPNLRLLRDQPHDVGTVWLDAPARLDVVVRDWRGRPIAGATVDAHRALRAGVSDAFSRAAELRYLMEPAATATTDAEGRAAFSSLPGGTWSVVARADGFAAGFDGYVTAEPGAARREVTLHLDEALRIEGRVVGGDRRPIARAVVWAYGGTAVATGACHFPHATTDDEGRFVLDGLRPGEMTLRVGRVGATPCGAEVLRVPASGPIEIVLDGGVVEGVVRAAEDGVPLEGARVLAYMGHTPGGVSIAEATTGVDGRYRLDTVRAGRPQWFRVERPGYVTIDETPVHTEIRPEVRFSSAPTTRHFVMRRGVRLAGRVTCSEGPVVGARIVANWFNRSTNGTWLVQDHGFTDGDGRYTLTAVAPTRVVVQVFAEGWYQEGLADFNWSSALRAGREIAHAIDVPPAGLPDVDIRLTRGCVVSGRVESSAGAPVEGASVSCVWTSTVTAEDGTFRLTAPVAGPSAAITAGLGCAYASQRIELSAGGRVEGVVLRLPRTARIGGRVTTSTGASVSGAAVDLVFRPVTSGSGLREWTVARVPVGDDGRFAAELEDREGRFYLRALAPGFATAASPLTAIETGRTTYQADLVLVPTQSLAGRVVSSADGTTPIVAARIALLPPDEDRSRRGRRTMAAVTDGGGRFRVPDVAAGDWFLDVDAEGFVRTTLAVNSPRAAGLVLELDPAFEIAGVVKLPGAAKASDVWDGGAGSSFWVMLRNERDRESWASAPVDIDGRFRATGLRSGTYTVSVSVRGGTVSVQPFETGGVPAGKTDVELMLSAAGEIAGRVLAPDGRPLGGCSVQAFSETGDRYTPTDTTEDDGTFVIRGVTSGTYRLEARPPEAERSGYVTQGAPLRPATATGVAVGAKAVEIRLTGGVSIRGRFLDAAGKPLAGAWVRAEVRSGQDLDRGVDSWFFGPFAVTDPTGRFTISGLATAHYRLVHVPDPTNPLVARPLKGGDDVVAGATDVRVVAGNLASIAGTVLDDDGKPVAGASIDLIAVGGGIAGCTRTDAAGRFTLHDASDASRYVVRATKQDFVLAQIDDASAGAAGLAIQMVRGLRASGRVLRSAGTPLAQGVVILTLEKGQHRASAVTDAEGRFTAAGLREGVYRVDATTGLDPSGSTANRRACGTIRAGDEGVELRMIE